MAEDFLTCCGRCDESGLPVQKLPEWKWNEADRLVIEPNAMKTIEID